MSRARASSSPAADKSAQPLLGAELPHNQDAEEGLLASMMLDDRGEVLNVAVASKLREEYFYFARHRKIYSAILALYAEGKPIDAIVLSDRLQSRGDLDAVGGIEELFRIAGRVETYAHFRHWLEIVREKYFLRTLILTCHDTIERAHANTDTLDMFLEDVETKIMGISQDRISNSAQQIDETVGLAMKEIETMIAKKGELTGIPTGFLALDDMLRGLHGTEMIVIAGRPGTGKTSIALNIAEHVALNPKKQVPVLVFSLEMGAKQLVMRMISSRAHINQRLLRQGKLQKDDVPDVHRAGAEMKKAPVWIDDSSDMTIVEMRAKARRLKQQHGIGLIVVDYLQLLKGVDSRVAREQQVAEMSRGMKAMAKELDVPVIVLAQLNRDSEKDNRDPKASDLRESGSIEQDADVILLLSWKTLSAEDREKIPQDSRLVKLEIAKQRNGPTGDITLMFDRNSTKYLNYTKRDENF